jgi:hypothetical protein
VTGLRAWVARRGPVSVAVLALVGLTLVLWAPVLAGQRSLLGGDILFNFFPWISERGAHEPRNHLVGDPVSQFAPWLSLVRDAFQRGSLPLWNPYSFLGGPLLANDQSSPFSPFTLIAALFADPTRGLSVVMPLKLWVAGIGAAVYIRTVGGRSASALFAGIAYAASGFMVVWLAYPHSSVATILPWCLAGIEWYLLRRKASAIVLLAIPIAVQFLAGHAETSLHLGFGLGLYVLVRLISVPDRRRALGGLVAAAVVGTLLSGAQLVPFVAELSHASIVDDRAAMNQGVKSLDWESVTAWLVPNAAGHPTIDGRNGRPPAYPETAAFAGVVTVVLAIAGPIVNRGRGRRPERLALVALVVFCNAVTYGPLTALVGRLPLLDVANNARFIVVSCFAVAALGALGLDDLLSVERARRRLLLARTCVAAAVATAGGLAVTFVWLVDDGEQAGELLPRLWRHDGYWVLVAGLCALIAIFAVGAVASGARPQPMAALLLVLLLVEAVAFAFPYNPRVPPRESPPESTVVAALEREAAGGAVAALALDLLPNTSIYERMVDARGVDTVINPRVRSYWSAADPDYEDDYLYTVFVRPDTRWLAAAGVTAVLTGADSVLPGTRPAAEPRGLVVSRVPRARPFAFAARNTTPVEDEVAARRLLRRDPLGTVVVEGAESATAAPRSAEVRFRRPTPERVDVTVDTPTATTVVVLQPYAPGWTATVDGEEAALRPANVLFQSVEVPAGRHHVVLRYRPDSVPLGFACSALGLIVLDLLLLISFRPRRIRTVGRADG